MRSDKFKSSLNQIGVTLSDEQIQAFDQYYEMLVEWNKVMNLTGITEYDEVWLKHYIDSLALNTVKGTKLNLADDLKIIDIGTGAGFPGLPLKIAYDNLDVTLLDSLNKRIKFLNEVIDQLKLSNIVTIHGRAEDFARDKKYRECFDLCVSRAVANLATLTEYCLPYVKTGGYFISFKSGEIDSEVKESEHAIKILGGKVVKVEKIKLPESDIERSFVVIEKVKTTSGKYPRKAGVPSKEPLV